MPIYAHDADYSHPREVVWNWYDSDGAFRRIMPEWEKLKPQNRIDGIKNGDVNTFKMKIGVVPQTWKAEHFDVVPGERFQDKMTKGPFKKWVHKHEFIEEGEHSSKLEDRVDWKLPFHFFTKFFSGILVTPRMKQMFRHRTRRVKADLNRHQTYANSPKQRILVSGSTGLIGEQLVAFLLTGGHEVHRLIRKSTKLAPDANKKNVVLWDDIEGKIIEGSMENFDAIIHLAGAGIGDKRWNKKRKKLIRDSRVIPTRNLVELTTTLKNPPSVFISGSAIGFYGNRGDESLDESSESGNGYLSETCKAWEQATETLDKTDIRKVIIRTGIVTTPKGGALEKLLFPAKMGAMGPVGGGKQMQSWISLDDQIFAIHHLLMNKELQGVFNLVAPNPVNQKTFAKALGKTLRRPAFAPLPGFVIKIMFGEMGKNLVLDGQGVRPKRLLESGYTFEHENIEHCLQDALGKWR